MKQRLTKLLDRSIPTDRELAIDPEKMAKLKTVSEAVLWGLAVAAGTGIAVLAPWLFIGIGALLAEQHPGREFTRQEKKQKLVRTFYYLKRHKYIKMKVSGADIKYYLTKIGKKKLKKLAFDILAVEKKGTWNKKWWQVAADIPTEDYKWAADLFRQKLKEMKFYALQRTLWFYPYDPRREIEFLVGYFGIGSFVTVMEINRLDQDDERKMKSFFREEKII